MSYALGYGHEVWSAGRYYFWIPMVAPFFGCLFGGWLYDVFIFTGMSKSPLPTLFGISWQGGQMLTKDNRGFADQHPMVGIQAYVWDELEEGEEFACLSMPSLV